MLSMEEKRSRKTHCYWNLEKNSVTVPVWTFMGASRRHRLVIFFSFIIKVSQNVRMNESRARARRLNEKADVEIGFFFFFCLSVRWIVKVRNRW